MKKIVIVSLAIVLSLVSFIPAYPMVPIVKADLSQKTGIAPAFFGPNAFPIPEMSTGTVPSGVSVDIAGDVYNGSICPGAKDMTYDMFINLRIPLYRNRVGLYIWMVPQEWYTMDKAVMDARRIQADDGKRNVGGDITVALEILLFKERKLVPAVTVRSVLKSAAGDGFGMARYYDCPGYFFDLTAAKSLYSSEDNFFRDFRLGASIGFLCWQTDNGRQNDAVQYGAFVSAKTSAFSIFSQFAGYSGWEKYGDCPMSLTARVAAGSDWVVSPFFQYQHGFRDWPFDQYRLGLSVDISKAVNGFRKRRQ